MQRVPQFCKGCAIVNDKKPCFYCKGEGRMPTDLHSESAVMWQPRQLCSPEGRRKFYAAAEPSRIAWLDNKGSAVS